MPLPGRHGRYRCGVSRRKRLTPAGPEPSPSGGPVSFQGFSQAPGHSVPESGLYEFWTADNVLIHMGETRCSRISFEPSPSQIEMTFVYEAPELAPAQLPQGASIRLLFRRVAMLRWEGDHTGPDPDDVPGGQITDLRFDHPNYVRLDLLSSHLQFTAQSVELTIT